MASKSVLFPSKVGTQVPRSVDVNPVKCVWNLDIRIIRDLCKCHDSDEISHIRNQYLPCSPCDGGGLGSIFCCARLCQSLSDGFAGRVDVLSRVTSERTDVKW